MTAELRQRLVLAGIGLVAGLAVVAAYFGGGDLLKHARSAVSDEAAPPDALQRAADLPGNGRTTAPPIGGDTDEQGRRAAIDPDAAPGAAPKRPARADAAPGATDRDIATKDSAGDPGAPSLDIVRIEPSGDAVIAGRGAPNAAIELLRDNKPVARVVADDTGQFAIVPPTLPSGNSAITLRATSPDGRTVEGRESVAVVVSPDRKTQPLVAVSEPDKPTRVLSQPQEQAGTATAGKGDDKRASKTEARKTEANKTALDAQRPGGESGPVRVVSVDAQDGGRLFVTGQGAAWASLRLYLNDTLVASGRSGADGRVAFTIGRGVRAGNYQVRIDQVEGESGRVRNRAQVAFAFPAQLAAREAVDGLAKVPAKVPAKATAKTAEAVPAAGKPDTAGKSVGPAATRETPAPPAAHAVPDKATGPVAAMPETSAGTKPDARMSGGATPSPATKAEPAPAAPAPPAGSPLRTAASAPPIEPKPNEQPGAVFVPEIDTARIIRGDNLWQISRRTYGDGKRYTVIYDANREQIRDPDLIYPGQVFVMPRDMQKDAPAADRLGSRRG